MIVVMQQSRPRMQQRRVGAAAAYVSPSHSPGAERGSFPSASAHHHRYQDCLYVPDYDPLRHRLLRTHHGAAAAGHHPGRSKTLELLKRTYFRPGM